MAPASVNRKFKIFLNPKTAPCKPACRDGRGRSGGCGRRRRDGWKRSGGIRRRRDGWLCKTVRETDAGDRSYKAGRDRQARLRNRTQASGTEKQPQEADAIKTEPAPAGIASLDPCGRRLHRKLYRRLFCFLFMIQAPRISRLKFVRICATSARVAVPAGSRIPAPLPLIRPPATAQPTASFA